MTTDAPPVDVPASRGLIAPGHTPLSPLNAARPPILLGAICVLAGVLYAWGMDAAGWGNPYYSAAVKSMSANLTNFVFGSFDPLGVVTVDKPPMALWPMVASAAVFGYHGWSLLLPQVIEGVAAVFLLHRTVRLWAGEHVALLAALVFAVTPVTVAINRDTNPDTLMVLLLVAAAYALSRALVSGKQCYNTVSHSRARRYATGWLLLAAVFLGLGFVTKMLQAWIVVPVFALAYLVGSPAPLRRRLLDVLGAGVVLLASSMWWVALVSFWPGPKPYIGGSTDGSVLNLVIGYNGLGRILGRQAGRELVGGAGMPGGFGAPRMPGDFGGPGRPGGSGPGGDAVGGGSGLTRLFGEQVGGQISWLLPLCLLVLVAVAIAGVRQWRSGQASEPARRAGWTLWGGWLLLVGLVLSTAQGGFHSYYTTEMAPAVAAVTAAGVAAMWRHYRRPGGYRWLLLPAAVTLTAGWAWVLVSRDISWNGWLRYAVVGAGIVAVVLLIADRLSVGASWGMARVAGVLAVVTLLAAPAVWSAATAVAASGGAMAQAGPAGSGFGFGGARADRARGVPAQFRGAMRGDLTAEQKNILAYAQANSAGSRITLAVDGGAMAAEAYLIHSNAMIIGMGGFSGQDPVPTVATVTQWVQQGQLRFVLASGRDSGGRDFGDRGPGGRGPRGGVSAVRTQWVQQHCAVVNPASYGSPAPNAAGPAARSEVLYDCQAGSARVTS
ncbi:MAG TPA: glycosyltransferase family 39 protein [Pseudonocardiaceae bacterium]|nr:glycosyltransferase family 39 protein [Pseudonocardiaceae bacterium]